MLSNKFETKNLTHRYFLYHKKKTSLKTIFQEAIQYYRVATHSGNSGNFQVEENLRENQGILI